MRYFDIRLSSSSSDPVGGDLVSSRYLMFISPSYSIFVARFSDQTFSLPVPLPTIVITPSIVFTCGFLC